MGFLSAIPLIGSLLDSVFSGIDRISTTDEERLQAKQAIMATAQPVIAAVLQAQAEFDKARFALMQAEIQSGDRLVRWTRPLMTWLTFLMWAYMALTGNPLSEWAWYAFGLIGGLWSASRGGEKIVTRWVNGERNGK